MYFLSAVSLAALMLSGPALAQDSPPQVDTDNMSVIRVDVHAALVQHGYFGVGGRVEFPLVPGGFLTGGLQDDLALSLGADVFLAEAGYGWNGYDAGPWVVPMALAQWNLYVSDRWSIFPEAGIAVHLGFSGDGWRDDRGRDHGWVYPGLALGFGSRYEFGPAASLLLRVGAPGGFQVGVVF